MLFNSYIFLFAFLPLVLIGYYGLNYFKKYTVAQVYLIGMSFWFYGYQNVYYLAILIVSVLLNFYIAKGMFLSKNPQLRKILLWVGVLLNLGILFYFKYYDFFIENTNLIFKTDLKLLHVVLPLGVSFYTFQQMSYIIDCYREECEHYSLVEYATYVTFFPQLIAGPIVYHTELVPQFRNEQNKRLNYDNLSKGIYAFSCGMAKKVLLADTFSKVVVLGYANISELNSVSTLVMMLCYTLQIYFDFSGYCDMAYGIGFMFNVELPVNFNSPYKALSTAEFWSRWHMTLTRFFTKYVYIPLGGSRKGTVRTYINILAVFLISGFWHGAAWHYIFWGIFQGFFVAGHKLWGKYTDKLPKIVRLLTTYSIFTFSLTIFRSETMQQAFSIWDRLLHGGIGPIYEPLLSCFNDLTEVRFLVRLGMENVIGVLPWICLIVFLVIVTIACFVMKNTQEKVNSMKKTNWQIVVVVVLLMWSVLTLSDVSEFLYYNF